jgi:hypothetical protein
MTVSFVVSAFHGKAPAVDSTMLFSKTMLLLDARLTRIPPGDFDRTPFALMVNPENTIWLEEVTARDDNTGVCPEAALIVRNCAYFRFEMLTAP